MQKLIKNGSLVDDQWVLIKQASDAGILQALPGRDLIVPHRFWKFFQDDIANYWGQVTIWLDSDERVTDIREPLESFPLIGLNFPVFSDGRSYTNARELRENLGYQGEIRALGDVLRDQLYYMHRCGFDAYSLRHDQDPDECLQAFDDFATGYQASIDQPQPLFRRR
ncbi:MAG: DUF934 domain-containing protein [Gammaproteobacteria bacterium]|nr:DUF934 domain-containing protein [Pseudomonadales bacterium]MCP5346344.1 DUF934 domain-containing protein [Pseudomonadales bacterium]